MQSLADMKLLGSRNEGSMNIFQPVFGVSVWKKRGHHYQTTSRLHGFGCLHVGYHSFACRNSCCHAGCLKASFCCMYWVLHCDPCGEETSLLESALGADAWLFKSLISQKNRCSLLQGLLVSPILPSPKLSCARARWPEDQSMGSL